MFPPKKRIADRAEIKSCQVPDACTNHQSNIYTMTGKTSVRTEMKLVCLHTPQSLQVTVVKCPCVTSPAALWIALVMIWLHHILLYYSIVQLQSCWNKRIWSFCDGGCIYGFFSKPSSDFILLSFILVNGHCRSKHNNEQTAATASQVTWRQMFFSIRKETCSFNTLKHAGWLFETYSRWKGHFVAASLMLA